MLGWVCCASVLRGSRPVQGTGCTCVRPQSCCSNACMRGQGCNACSNAPQPPRRHTRQAPHHTGRHTPVGRQLGRVQDDDVKRLPSFQRRAQKRRHVVLHKGAPVEAAAPCVAAQSGSQQSARRGSGARANVSVHTVQRCSSGCGSGLLQAAAAHARFAASSTARDAAPAAPVAQAVERCVGVGQRHRRR